MRPPINSAGRWAAHGTLRALLGETEYAASHRGVVFAHTVGGETYSAGKAKIISQCECVFAVLPAPFGWKVFHERAGLKPSGTYGEFLDAVKRTIIDAFGKPTYLVCPRGGERLSHVIPRPIRISGLANDRGSLMAISNTTEWPDADNTDEFLAALARRYRSVYDFACGYGNSLRPFGYGVGSDIDQKCLDYIAREILWTSPKNS